MHVIVGISGRYQIFCMWVGALFIWERAQYECVFTHLGFSFSSLTCMVSGTSFELLVMALLCLPAGLYSPVSFENELIVWKFTTPQPFSLSHFHCGLKPSYFIHLKYMQTLIMNMLITNFHFKKHIVIFLCKKKNAHHSATTDMEFVLTVL